MGEAFECDACGKLRAGHGEAYSVYHGKTLLAGVVLCENCAGRLEGDLVDLLGCDSFE